MKTTRPRKNIESSWQLSAMMIVTVLTQFISVYKSSLIAANFGAGVELDAYNFANNLATFFLTFISSGVTTVVIPAYVKRLDKKAVDTFLTVIFMVTGILVLCTFVFRGILVDVLTSREPMFKEYVCNVMLLTIWIQFLPAILGVTTAYYQCIGRFTLPKVILLSSNIVTVIILLVLDEVTLYQYLNILLIGAVLQFVIDLGCALHYGFRFKISFDIKNPVYKELMNIFIPTLFSSGLYKINTMIDSLLSSNLGAGQLTILSYSNTIVGMVNTLIIGNLIVYVYPKIVESVSKSKQQGQRILWKYTVLFHIAVCLIVVGFVSVGREFIGILYEHGEFTSSAANSVYICMCIYMFAQQNNIVRDLIYRYFFAVGDTRSTVRNGFLTSCINIITSIILVRFIGVYGIILGTFIAGACSLLVILARFRIKFGFEIELKIIVQNLIKTESIVIGSIVMVMIIKNLMGIKSQILGFLIYGVISVIIFGIGIYLIHRKTDLIKD